MDKPEIKGYEILEPVGEGGMATVYLAIQENFQRKVAVKILAKNLLSDSSFGERFLREARIVAQLSHQHIVPVFDVGQQGDIHYIAMELLPGGDLKQKLRKGLPLLDSLTIIKQISSALDYAAARGFVHRDIKPENILFREDGSAVVSDFGIARSTDSKTNMTLTGTVIGTPHYMSPEQAQATDLDGRSDLYSVGVILFEMLAGHVPFTADSAISIGIKHITDPIPELAPEQAEFQPFIDKVLAKHPDDRFQTGRELIDALEDLEHQLKNLDQATVVITPDSRRNSGSRNSGTAELRRTTGRTVARGTNAETQVSQGVSHSVKKSRNSILTLTIAGIVAAGGAGGWYWWQSQQQSTPTIAKSPVFNQKTRVLLEQARTAMTEGRLFEPPGNNAQYFYTTALALAPNDQQATAGIEQLVNVFMERSQAQMQQGNLESANDWLNRSFQIAFYVRDSDIIERQQSLRGELFQSQQKSIRMAEQERQIGQQLEQAKQALDAGRLTSPIGDNAYDFYQSVLTLEPDNAAARAGVSNIAAEYLRQAKELAGQENFTRARALVAAAVQIDNTHIDLPSTQAFIVEQEDAISKRKLEQAQQQVQAADFAVQQARDEQRRKKAEVIASLLSNAGVDFIKNRLQSPVGDNAVEKYQQVLALDPSNLEALEGLQNVGERYVELARTTIANKNIEKSQEYLGVAQKLVPSSPNLAAARRELIGAKELAAKAADLVRQQEQVIESLLGGAQQDINADRLISPASDNALLKYRQALSIDAINQDALEGRKTVVRKVIKNVDDDIDNGRFIEAKDKLVTLNQFVPGDNDISKAKNRLQRAQANFKKHQQTIRSLELQASRLQSQTTASDNKLVGIYKSLLAADHNNDIALQGLKSAGQYELNAAINAVKKRQFKSAEQHLSNVDSYGVTIAGIEAARTAMIERQALDRQVKQHTLQASTLITQAISQDDPLAIRNSIMDASKEITQAKSIESDHPEVAISETKLKQGFISLISKFTDQSKFKLAHDLIADSGRAGVSSSDIEPYKVALDEKHARDKKRKRSTQNMGVF